MSLLLTPHSASNLERVLSDAELDKLGTRLAEQGGVPDSLIVATFDNQIVKGVSLYEAMRRRGFPITEAMVQRVEVSEAKAFELAARLLLDQQAVSKAQRPMVVGDLVLALRSRGDNAVSVADMGGRFEVSKKNVENAMYLRRIDSELAEWVKNGPLTVNAGLVLSKPDKRDQRSQVLAWLQAGDKKAVAKLLNANKARGKPASRETNGVTSFDDLFDVLQRIPKLPAQMMKVTERIRSGAMIVGDGVRARRVKAAIETNLLNATGVAESAQALIDAIDTQLSAISEKSGQSLADAAE